MICEKSSPFVSEAIAICGDCLREGSARAEGLARQAHARTREKFGLPPSKPARGSGKPCEFCLNACRPEEGELGLCGLRRTESGRVRSLTGTPREAVLNWYHDPLPTNCCADWVCPGGSACGYPEYSHAPGAERGYKNLAVFYYGCTFDCLFCQNWQWRYGLAADGRVSALELAEAVDAATSCICYFGGDPTPQLSHAIHASRLAVERARSEKRILRICWETNGAMNPKLLRSMADLSLESGGCIKFDLKAHNGSVHRALCGTDNMRTLDNFSYLAGRRDERPEIPLLIAATLLVPGYIDAREVGSLAGFIASLNPDIPYVLLAFHPSFEMADLATTWGDQAERCHEQARAAGLTNVRIGNLHLLRG
jgi:pyruvate formate lyase activating enzyme